MIRRMTFIAIFFVPAITINFAGVAHASVSEQENIEAIKATMAAEQSVGRTLGSYLLTDQNGKRFDLKEFYDKPLIVSFIYTGCPHTCSTITSSLAAAIKEIGSPPVPLLSPLSEVKEGGLNVVTIGFDYERDTPERMMEFGKSFTNDFTHWKFVTTDRDTLERLSRDIGFYFSKRGDGFSHLNMISIVAGGKVYQHIYGVNIKGSDIVAPLNELLTNRREGKRLANPVGWRDRLLAMCSLYDESTHTYRINYYYLLRFSLELTALAAIFFFMWKKEVYSLYAHVMSHLMRMMARIKGREYASSGTR